MTRHEIAEVYGEELMFIDPERLDKCVIGIATRCGMPPVTVYDRDQLILAFMEDGMTEEEASEYISYNIEGAYVGEATPLVMERV